MAASGLSCGTWDLRCGMWDLRFGMQDLLLWCVGSSSWRSVSLVEARGLSSCGAWAQLPHGMWDLSSLTRDQTHIPCIGRWILNHWTAREVPGMTSWYNLGTCWQLHMVDTVLQDPVFVLNQWPLYVALSLAGSLYAYGTYRMYGKSSSPSLRNSWFCGSSDPGSWKGNSSTWEYNKNLT